MRPSSCRGARAAFDVQHGGVIVVTLVAKGSPPGAGNPEAEPQPIVGFFAAVVAIRLLFALLLLCDSNALCWQAAVARQAGSNGC